MLAITPCILATTFLVYLSQEAMCEFILMFLLPGMGSDLELVLPCVCSKNKWRNRISGRLFDLSDFFISNVFATIFLTKRIWASSYGAATFFIPQECIELTPVCLSLSLHRGPVVSNEPCALWHLPSHPAQASSSLMRESLADKVRIMMMSTAHLKK